MMTLSLQYFCVFLLLLVVEFIYIKIAEHLHINDQPNLRSSHQKTVARGGGIIFLIGAWVWSIIYGFPYPWFLAGLTLAAGVSFIDDIRPTPPSLRLVVHFVAMMLVFYQLDMFIPRLWWAVIAALIIWVGATNIYNFMDGINGITAAYSLSVLVPVLLLLHKLGEAFVAPSLVVNTILSVLVFGLFNFRPKNKARCFAGDVGSIGIAVIILFIVGRLVMTTLDVTYLILLVVYGVDGCCTIFHRILLHERLSEPHRKHAYQLMANELGMSHITVSLFYMTLQLVISLVMVYVIPRTILAHCIYLAAVLAVLITAYVLFMKKYYHLHEEYLESLKK